MANLNPRPGQPSRASTPGTNVTSISGADTSAPAGKPAASLESKYRELVQELMRKDDDNAQKIEDLTTANEQLAQENAALKANNNGTEKRVAEAEKKKIRELESDNKILVLEMDALKEKEDGDRERIAELTRHVERLRQENRGLKKERDGARALIRHSLARLNGEDVPEPEDSSDDEENFEPEEVLANTIPKTANPTPVSASIPAMAMPSSARKHNYQDQTQDGMRKAQMMQRQNEFIRKEDLIRSGEMTKDRVPHNEVLRKFGEVKKKVESLREPSPASSTTSSALGAPNKNPAAHLYPRAPKVGVNAMPVKPAGAWKPPTAPRAMLSQGGQGATGGGGGGGSQGGGYLGG